MGKIFEFLEEIDRKGEISKREPFNAVLFSLLCPGIGQMYAGKITRGIALYIALIIASWFSAIMFMLIESRISIILFLVPVAGFIMIAADAHCLASRQQSEYRLRWFNRAWLYFGVFTFLLISVNPLMNYIVGGHIVRAFAVFSDSMSPSVIKYDLVLIDKVSYKTSSPKRGDIVLVEFKGGKPSRASDIIDNELIRRIIAVPGDIVEVSEGNVLINNIPVKEPYALIDRTAVMDERKVPSGSYFVLGDNRIHSIDSLVLGFVPEERIGGKISKIFWSWNYNEGKIMWERTGKSLT